MEFLLSLLHHWPWLAAAVVFLMSVFTVDQQTVSIVTRFGKFARLAQAGLNFRIPIIESADGRLSLKVHQLDVKVDTKTEDNVLVSLAVAVQYAVMPERVYDAFYRLRNASAQIEAYVADATRSKAPTLTLDQLYEAKDEVAGTVENALKSAMAHYGYAIVKVLIVNISPDEKVMSAMNDINTAQRERVAAQARADADKILKITAAQADAESMRLMGQGIANQRKAILEGLAAAVAELQEKIPGITVQEIMNVIMMTRYFDALREMAESGNLTTVMLPGSPGGFGDLREQILSALVAGKPAAPSGSTD